MPNAAININGHYPLHWRYLLEAWPHQLHATKELASRLLEVFVSKEASHVPRICLAHPGIPRAKKNALIASPLTTCLLLRYDLHRLTLHTVESPSEQTLISSTRLQWRGQTYILLEISHFRLLTTYTFSGSA